MRWVHLLNDQLIGEASNGLQQYDVWGKLGEEDSHRGKIYTRCMVIARRLRGIGETLNLPCTSPDVGKSYKQSQTTIL